MEIRDLKHVRINLTTGAKILVLNTGAIIGPESEAMLQALHSRSVGGIEEHLETLAKKGSEKFMSTFYVGYGHKSIGDCGTCTIFIEGVSMLVAKAIQDWPLYSGQESSTRYIDFATQPFIDPLNESRSREIMDEWRKFYLHGLEIMKEALKDKFPRNEEESEVIYEKTINARAFDVMRGFLPSGAATNLAWHSNLRQVADKLMVLRHHPLPEVKSVANAIEDAVIEAFPSSFNREKHYTETEKYNSSWMAENYLYHELHCPEFKVSNDNINRAMLWNYRRVVESRPPKTELPKQLAEVGTMQFTYQLDFGSFRDIQRQRAVTQRMPLVTADLGFEEWYLEEITPDLRKEAVSLIKGQERRIQSLEVRREMMQYYLAMGYKLSNRLTGNLHALVYLVELRTTRFVHPTARKVAKKIAKELEERFGRYGLVLHLDKEPDRFDIKRGEQDILSKEAK